MYSLKVHTRAESETSPSHDKLKGLAEDFRASVSGTGSHSQESMADGKSTIGFSSGNPRVEARRGVVHLFRDTTLEVAPRDHLPEQRSENLCVLAVPMHMTGADFCRFTGSFLESIREMSIVRMDGCSDRYMVLIKFNSHERAKEFYLEYQEKPFSSMEPAVCRVLFIREVHYTSSSQDASTPPSGLTELPSCPVCLERLDQHISGILTTVCNHSFHSACISKWTDSSCPVCRHCQQEPERSTCSVCGASEELWICLVCGFVGCGRYQRRHAVEHWRSTQHCYSLELETQRVWDYVGDGYVHRLIQSKTDGKLVELPAPGCDGVRRGSTGGAAGGALGGEGECSMCECQPREPEVEEAIMASKIEAIGYEYNQLLTSQLEVQREYYEGLRVESTAARAAEVAAAAEKLAAQKSASKIEKLEQDVSFLREVNNSLIRNQKEWQTQLQEQKEREQKLLAERDLRIQDLEEQVRDLMVFIEAQRTLEKAGNTDDIRDGTVMAVPVPSESNGNGASGRAGLNGKARRAVRKSR